MTGKTAGRKENKPNVQQVSSVASKCLAMVVCAAEQPVNGKEIFDDFQLRNSTCYWNSALSESIRNLQYLGFLEPNTILLGGTDVCLENLRMAWGRRVLNDPHNCKIEKIGDISNITMQEVPQNHFIPLPEILCLIILDLNNKQILATVDIIQAQLKKCYQGTQLPSNQLVYETLHSLIQDSKIFHTGSGYFVVTPDTLRLPVNLPSPRPTQHHNPMYLPMSNPTTPAERLLSSGGIPMTTVAMTQTLPPVRSISCQVTGSLANHRRASSPEVTTRATESDKPRLNRSLSARRYKDRNPKDLTLKIQDDCLTNKDVHVLKTKITKVKGEKKSLLSKLFGKKKKENVENKVVEKEVKKCKPEKEYATFSAQFPPPEWQWYQEQYKKHERTKDWVSQQVGRTLIQQTSTAHKNIQEIKKDALQCKSHSPATLATTSSGSHPKSHKHSHKPSAEKLHTYHEIEAYKPQCNKVKLRQHPFCVQELPPEAQFQPIKEPHHIKEHHQKTPDVQRRRSKSHHRKSHRHSMDVSLLHRQYAHQNANGIQPMVQPQFQYDQNRLHAVPPLYSSTPRNCERVGLRTTGDYVEMCTSPVLREINHADKEHRSRKRRSKHYKRIENDITYEYHGRLPRKHSNKGMSRDSGVNCVGLSENQPQFCYNQLAEYENVKSNNLRKSMEMQLNSLHQNEGKNNEIICVAEINACAPSGASNNDYVELDRLDLGKDETKDENVNSLELSKTDESGVMDSSEQSYDTVIHKKLVQDVSKETENLTLGDSGFYSPRVTETEMDKNRNKMKLPLYKNLTYDHLDLNKNLKDFQKEKIVLNNEFYKEPSLSSDYQVVGVV